MSLIRNGYAISSRRGSLGVLFSALLALALFDSAAATAQEVKQIKLTDKHIQNFIAAHEEMAKLYEGANPDKPDPKVDAQAEAIAKKNGFASLVEHATVTMNVAMIMSGIDPETKKFTEPFELIEESEAGAAGIPGEPENASSEGAGRNDRSGMPGGSGSDESDTGENASSTACIDEDAPLEAGGARG